MAVLASLNFVMGIGKPMHPVWDESYYLTAIARYHEGRAQFASHPPLGLLLLTAGDSLVRSYEEWRLRSRMDCGPFPECGPPPPGGAGFGPPPPGASGFGPPPSQKSHKDLFTPPSAVGSPPPPSARGSGAPPWDGPALGPARSAGAGAGAGAPPPHALSAQDLISWNKTIAGDDLPISFSFFGPRIASGVFAVLGAIAFFALMCLLTRALIPALLFSNLYIFENAFVVHFRAAQLDAFQITFLICALLCFVTGMRRRPNYLTPAPRNSRWLDFALGAAIGCAAMVKISAVLFALFGVMLVAYRLSYSRTAVSSRFALAVAAARDCASLCAGFLIVVAAVFTVHVAISPNPPNAKSSAGQKDLRFVSPTYLDFLEGRRALSPPVIIAAATDYARFIVADEAGIPRSDTNGSHPYQWPFHYKTINYRWDSNGAHTSYSQLAGNPIGWDAALLAIVLATALWVTRGQSPSSPQKFLMAALLAQYALVLAAHLFLDSRRVLYLYHYFPALLIAFCLCPLVLQEIAARLPRFGRYERRTVYVLTALLPAVFLFYAPLSFHQPLTHSECERRNAIQPIVDCR